MKRRGLTLAGSVVGTILFSLLTFGALITLPILSTASYVTSTVPETSSVVTEILPLLMGLMSVSLIFYITCLVLNACTIPAFSASPEKYRSRKGLIITTIVFDFIAGFYSFGVLIFQFVAYFNPFAVFSLLMQLGILASGILLLVDLCREKSRINGLQNEPAPKPAPRPVAPQPVADLRPMKDESPKVGIDMLEFELSRLNRLKANGVITEEEYINLKQKILEKF